MNPLVALPAEKVAVNPELARALKYAVALYVGVTVQAGVFVYAVAKVTVHAVGEPLPIVTTPATPLPPCCRVGAVPQFVMVGPCGNTETSCIPPTKSDVGVKAIGVVPDTLK